jgi:hypothetical protein
MRIKTFFLSAAVMFYWPMVHAQQKSPLKKLYAYKQASVSGIKSGNPAEPVAQKTETYSYWFYLVLPSARSFTVKEIWINGKNFSPKTEPVNQLPVKKINYTDASSQEEQILVPATQDAVVLTYPASAVMEQAQISKYLKDLVTRYELVITYFWKGKKFYKVARKISELEPDMRM